MLIDGHGPLDSLGTKWVRKANIWPKMTKNANKQLTYCGQSKFWAYFMPLCASFRAYEAFLELPRPI